MTQLIRKIMLVIFLLLWIVCAIYGYTQTIEKKSTLQTITIGYQKGDPIDIAKQHGELIKNMENDFLQWHGVIGQGIMILNPFTLDIRRKFLTLRWRGTGTTTLSCGCPIPGGVRGHGWALGSLSGGGCVLGRLFACFYFFALL